MKKDSILRHIPKKYPFWLLLFLMVVMPGGLWSEDQSVDLRTKTDSLHSLGDSLIKTGKYDSAQVVLESEIKLREKLSDSIGLAKSLNLLSKAFLREGKNEEGLEATERALKIIRMTVGEEDTLAADSYNNIGIVYDNLGDYEKALKNYSKSLTILLKALGPEHSYVAKSYNNIGIIYHNLGNYEKALEIHKKSLSISLKTLGSEHPDAAKSYNIIGNVYWRLGDYEKALENYNKSLTILLKTLGPEHPYVTASHTGTGIVYDNLGDYKKALENFEKALSIRLKVLGSEHPDVARDYNNIGIVYWRLGDYEKALENHRKAFSIWLKALGPEHPYVAYSYNNIGIVYDDLGDYEKALENYKKSLAIKLKALGLKHPDVANSYTGIGSIYSELGNYEKALENYNKALAIDLKVKGPEHPDVALSYSNIGNVYSELDDYKKALENYNKALLISLKALGPEHPDVALSYNNIGNVYSELDDYKKALENFNKALSIWLKALGPEHPLVAKVYYEIGRTLRAQKRPEQALGYLKKSIAITEKVRIEVKSEELKKTYTEMVKKRYEEIITLLLEMSRPKEAFEYYERSKSKLLQDELQKKGIKIGIGELKKKVAEVQTLSQKVGALENQIIDEKSKPKPNKIKIENLTRLLAKTKGEFYKLIAEIKQNPDYAFTVTVDPIQFASIQKALPEGNNLVMYYSSQEKLYVFIISKEGYTAKSVDVSKDSLNTLVEKFRNIMERPQFHIGFKFKGDSSSIPLGKILTTLYRYLIEPVQEEISKAEEVTFIPSGNLYYIPFGVLAHQAEEGKLRFLIEEKTISYLTSAELFRYIERKAKEKADRYDLLIVGNPAGAELLHAEEEAKAIHILHPESKLYVDVEATESRVKKDAPTQQILHLATHCYPNPENPWESYVYLAEGGEDDGRWTVAEVTNETWDRMSLVILSACKTAIGGDKPGLEMESMARAFSIAGAPSIIATLWPVADESTRKLMLDFYQNLKIENKAEALRQAQLALLHNPQYSHPYFWAPFILIGEWR